MKKGTVAWLVIGGGIAVTLLLFRSKISQAIQDWEVRLFLNRLSPYQSIVTEYVDEYSLDEILVKAVIWKESSGNPNAKKWEGGDKGYSRGLMGLLYTTAQQMGFPGEPDDLFDPDTNVHYGTAYLRWQLDRYSEDVRKALSAYNAGTYTEVNKQYVDKVLEYYSRIKKEVES